MRIQLKIFFTTVMLITLFGCDTNTTKEKELELKERELAIREKELELKQKDSAQGTTKNATVLQEQKFEVPLGKTVNGFNYSRIGQLTFNGKHFAPNIKATIANVPKFKISMLDEKNIAAAIALDIDGQNFLFLLDLSSMTATPFQTTDSWNAAQEIYWSPSTKYMVALCAYEGESFVSINTVSKRIVKMGNLKPGNNYETRWIVDNEPKWDGNKDILVFNVAEYCNPYEAECGENADKVLSKFKVNLDASTLKIFKSK